MKKLNRVPITILACLIIVISSAGYALAEDTKNEEKQESITITFYRYGVDGSITPINTEIAIGDGQDFDKKIAAKCDELLQNDVGLQKQLENLTKNLTISAGILFIRSSGKGFHYESKTRTKILKRPKILSKILDKINIFKIKLPKINLFKKKTHIFCRYAYDVNANTTITPLIRSAMNESYIKTIHGRHSIYVYNFIGYTSWIGRFSFSPFDILPRAFVGYGRVAICNDLG